MPRTKGAPDIKGWREHGLLRDLALNEESVEALAEKYSIQVDSVYTYRWRNKHRINVVLAEWSNEFSDLWAVKKHARVADLQSQADTLQARINEMEEDAERATEVMRRVDPDAAPVRVSPLREYRGLIKDKARLLDQIEDSMGQKVAHAGALGGNTHLLPFMGLRSGKDTIDHAKFLALRPDEQTVYLGMIPHFQAMFLKLTEAQRERFLEFLGEEDTWQAYGYMQECLELPHERLERLRKEQIMVEAQAKWLAEHPSESDDEAPADTPAPVEEPDLVKDVEPVDLIRMMPAPGQQAPVQVPEVEPVTPPVQDVAVDKPVELEMPPVADHVAQAARELAIHIWGMGSIPHPGPHLDQLLAHAASRDWLVVDANRIVRGEVDPRPVTVTRIPV